MALQNFENGVLQMEREELLKRYPNLLSLLDEDIDERRYLVVVDPNVEEEADEADVFDPTEYNWMIFLPERIKEALGEELFAEIPSRLEKVEIFEDFLDDDEDLFGVWSEADEESIAQTVLQLLEELAAERKKRLE
jgi:hypothetical protein